MKLFIKLRQVCFISLLFGGLLCQQAMAKPVELWGKSMDKSFNFFQVTPSLYRSGMPTTDKVAELNKNHIVTIISFIKNDDKAWLGDHSSIDLIRYPVHADRVTDDDVLYVLRMILKSQQERGNVLIHCKHGQNRTGIFAAMYRIIIQGWTKEQAVLEMAKGGYTDDLNDIKDAIAYIKKAKVKKIRQALAHNDCSTKRFALCYWFGS